jgi:thymidylate kinase
MAYQIYAIEGLDRLGKSTLIDGILNKKGYYEVVHFSKPRVLSTYQVTKPEGAVPEKSLPLWHYQRASFRNSMLLATSKARLIFDRWHLGEAVYSPLYRGYSGDYVFDFERVYDLDQAYHIQLILLVEDFEVSRHFVDDGESFDVNGRAREQELFIEAFQRSIIPNKRLICVTDRVKGGFRRKDDILAEALET